MVQTPGYYNMSTDTHRPIPPAHKQGRSRARGGSPLQPSQLLANETSPCCFSFFGWLARRAGGQECAPSAARWLNCGRCTSKVPPPLTLGPWTHCVVVACGLTAHRSSHRRISSIGFATQLLVASGPGSSRRGGCGVDAERAGVGTPCT
jgi:hypothetical protein